MAKIIINLLKSASLQDLEIEQDPRDTRCLTIRSTLKGSHTLQQLIFDDNIRSLAARQVKYDEFYSLNTINSSVCQKGDNGPDI